MTTIPRTKKADPSLASIFLRIFLTAGLTYLVGMAAKKGLLLVMHCGEGCAVEREQAISRTAYWLALPVVAVLFHYLCIVPMSLYGRKLRNEK
jgi:hypothetical protein